jgi:hypothetical protein
MNHSAVLAARAERIRPSERWPPLPRSVAKDGQEEHTTP